MPVEIGLQRPEPAESATSRRSRLFELEHGIVIAELELAKALRGAWLGLSKSEYADLCRRHHIDPERESALVGLLFRGH